MGHFKARQDLIAQHSLPTVLRTEHLFATHNPMCIPFIPTGFGATRIPIQLAQPSHLDPRAESCHKWIAGDMSQAIQGKTPLVHILAILCKAQTISTPAMALVLGRAESRTEDLTDLTHILVTPFAVGKGSHMIWLDDADETTVDLFYHEHIDPET